MASSHRWNRQDRTVLYCLVGVRGVNWIGDKSRLSATENFDTALPSLEMRRELSLVLSWPSFQFATWLRIVTSYLETGSRLVHKCIHTADETGQNCSVSNILRTTENWDCRELRSHRQQDKTVLSCRCWWCELGISVLLLTMSFLWLL